MDTYEFTDVPNESVYLDLVKTFGDALNALRPDFINCEIPLEKSFVETQIDVGALPEDTTLGSYQRVMTLHVAVDGIPVGDGARNVSRLLAELGYKAHKQYVKSYWMTDIPHKVVVNYYTR